MYTKKTILIFSILVIGRLHSQKVYSLEGAINYALQHNFDYQKSSLDKMITYEKTQEVLTQGFPKVNGSLGYQNAFVQNTSVVPGEFSGKPGTLLPVKFGTTNNVNASIGVTQLIFDGRYLVGLQARAAIKELSNIQVAMSERDVKALISKSYYQAMTASKSLQTLRDSKVILDNLYDQTQKTYKQGLIEELDVERLQYNVKTLSNTIDVLETQSQLALSALKLNMGYPMEDTLVLVQDIKSDLTHIANQNYLQSNLENRIELKLVNQAITLKKYDIKQLNYSGFPSVFGSFNFGFQAFRQQFDFYTGPYYNYGNFGIQASIPIYDGGTKKSILTQSKLELKKIELEKEHLANALKIESMNALLSLRNQVNDYNNQNDILKLSEKIERKTQVKYKEGIGSSFEFASAQNERIQQYLKLLQSELKLLTNYIDFKKSNGNL
jgi:outer membrane protein